MKVNREFHHIQRHIIRVLGLNEWARYRDLRLEGVDSSLYNYHLKELMKTGLIEKVVGKGYHLTSEGLRYVDHVSINTFEPRWQPKLISKLVITDENDRVLMYRKMRQPFIGTWNLPGGKVHYEDESIHAAAARELGMILCGNMNVKPSYCGVVELTVTANTDAITHTIYFVHSAKVPSDALIDSAYRWVDEALTSGDDATPSSYEITRLAKQGNSERYVLAVRTNSLISLL